MNITDEQIEAIRCVLDFAERFEDAASPEQNTAISTVRGLLGIPEEGTLPKLVLPASLDPDPDYVVELPLGCKAEVYKVQEQDGRTTYRMRVTGTDRSFGVSGPPASKVFAHPMEVRAYLQKTFDRLRAEEKRKARSKTKAVSPKAKKQDYEKYLEDEDDDDL